MIYQAYLLDIEGTVRKLPAWVRHFKIGSPMFLIVVRIIPGLGGTIATQTAAALRVPIWRQIYTMCAIAVPICTALAIGGNALSGFIDDKQKGEIDSLDRQQKVSARSRARGEEEPSPFKLAVQMNLTDATGSGTRIDDFLLARLIAEEAGLDEKSIRASQADGWNPRAQTLQALEALLPDGWRAGDPIPSAEETKKSARAA